MIARCEYVTISATTLRSSGDIIQIFGSNEFLHNELKIYFLTKYAVLEFSMKNIRFGGTLRSENDFVAHQTFRKHVIKHFGVLCCRYLRLLRTPQCGP